MTLRDPLCTRSICSALLLLCYLGAAAPTAAQEKSAPRLPEGTVSGAVVDAVTSDPLSGATLVLEPDTGGAMPALRTGGDSFLRGNRVAVTDSAGWYSFTEVAPGRYRLRITRAGYRAETLSVELRGSVDSRVSVGLQMEPIALAALRITAPPPQPFGRDASVEAETQGSRVRAARQRQEAHLSSDVRELTHADVVEAVTLGETDIFRALQRLPGVTARDSYSAELWLRGASWDQTRVYFDGIPLFNPLHGGGLLSGVNPDALSGALLYPGVQPASLGDGVAGVVDLSSRPGGGAGELRGSADLSVTSARVALDQRTPGGRAAWMLAGRRSYVDLLTRAVNSREPFAYSFSDLTGRADLQIDSRRALQASWLWARDASGDRSSEQPYNRGHWGNAAGRISYSSAVGRLSMQHTVGASRYSSIVREPSDSIRQSLPWIVGHTDNQLTHGSFAGELSPLGHEQGEVAWRVGYQAVREDYRYDGPPPRQDPASGQEQLELDTSLLRGALWGERRWRPHESFTFDTGLRLEMAPAVRNAGALRLAPRFSARFGPIPGLTLSASLGRSYQYVQGLAPVGLSVLTDAPASKLWLLADAETPAVMADAATFGGEAWLGDSWLASVNSFVRHSTGVALPDPTPGLELGSGPLFVAGESRARGVELSLRRLAGRWTASAAYSYLHAETEAAGLRFPSPTERTHTLDATTMFRVGGSLRLGAAYTAASGIPFTRIYLPTRYQAIHSECAGDPECLRANTLFGAPYAERTPLYSRLDLLVDWFHRFRSWEFGAYLQLHNALDTRNLVDYGGTYDFCPGGGTFECSEQQLELRDQFNRDLPIFPLVGFRVRF